ncbi:TPA: hypothetical protein ACIGS8_005230, partial [Escherichia coli]
GQVFHNPVLSRITELVTATRPDGDNNPPSLVVFGELSKISGMKKILTGDLGYGLVPAIHPGESRY